MKRIQIPTDIIRNPLVSHNTIYLYLILKTMTSSLKVTAYSTTILEKAQWNDRRTLKKYLLELKQKELISYNFNDFPINKPLLIEITPILKGTQFTQVDIETIQRIIDVAKNIPIDILTETDNQNTQDKQSVKQFKYNPDLKEMAIRLFYLYESYYNINFNVAFPSYRVINSDTKISNTYIKILNKIFNDNELVIVNYGQKIDWNKKSNNTYVPICDRPELKTKPESDNNQDWE